MTIDQIKAKVEELGRRYKTAISKKASLGGLLEAKKTELINLKKEIEAAGLDPKRLKESRDELQAEVAVAIEEFERKLSVVEAAFEKYDNKVRKES